MTQTFDVAIIGLGAAGSAAAWQLAKRGQSVVGIEQFVPPHAYGSSHGHTRIIREAYYEHPLYVPLVRRAYELWGELERESGGLTLLLRTGGVMIGSESSALVRGALESAKAHRIPHEVLSAGKLHRRFPSLSPLDEMVGVLETRAGVLLPEKIIGAQLNLAARHGAVLKTGEAVVGWEATPEGVVVRTAQGRYGARQLVFAAGAWTGALLGELAPPLVVERQVMHFFEPSRSAEEFGPERMPVSIWQLGNGQFFYTTPDVGHGVKVGVHHGGATTTPERVDRRVTPDEDAIVYDLLRRFLPFAKGRILGSAVCLYTNTPDGHFVIDRLPGVPACLLVSACSGHGFKFASAIGEAVAELVVTGSTRTDLSPFRLARFGSPAHGSDTPGGPTHGEGPGSEAPSTLRRR